MSKTVPTGANAKMPGWVPKRSKAAQIAFWYFGLSVLWIFSSGRVLHHYVHDEARVALLENVKGWFFVSVTALLLGLVLNSLFRQMRRSALKLQESEAQLRLLGDNLPGAYIFRYEAEANGRPRFTYVSAGVERIHGIKPADVLRDADFLRGMVLPESRPALAAAEAASAKTLTDFEIEVWVTNPAGEPRLMHLHSHPHRSPDGWMQWDGVAMDITERKRAEAAIREANERLKKVIEVETVGVMFWDLSSGAMVDANDTFLKLMGYSRREVEQRELTWQKLTPPEFVEASRVELGKFAATGRVGPYEKEYLRKDGTRQWLLFAGSSLGNNNCVEFCVDISDRKKAEAALRESEIRYRSLFEASRDAIMTLDPASGKFTSGNPAAVRMFAAGTEAEFISHGPADFSPERQPDGRLSSEKAGEIDGTVLRDGSLFFEWIHRRLDGVEFFADVLLTRMELAGKPAVLANVRDVSERKQAEQERTRLATAMEQAAESILITDHEGNIVYVNPAFELVSGYSRAEVVGKNPRILKSGNQDTAFYQHLWETLRRGEVWHGRFVNQRKDGRQYEEDATISPVRDGAGKIVNYVAIKLDVTREVELEAQFRQAQKMEAVGQLAGGVAHDFNNILGVIIGYSRLIASDLNPDSPLRAYAEEIREASMRASNLTRQLLLFSRRQAMQPRDLELNEVVASLAKMLQRLIGEHVNLQLNLHPGPLAVRADAGMLDQVLMNLAINARDAMPRGGRLLIETGERDVDGDIIRLHPEVAPGRYVCLNVSDNGEGIPPAVMPRIFDPFFTTKAPGKGTGLGLATVFGIVKQHRGWVDVLSEPGQGASFQIFIPAIALAPAEFSPSTAKPRGGSETILLVEDDHAVRGLTRKMLERCGYRVLEAASGEEAVKLWPEHRHQIVLLLTDLVMPGGVSGPQLARRLQEDNPRLKVIYTSGYSAEISESEIELRSGENFVQKPVAPDQLAETIRRCLDD